MTLAMMVGVPIVQLTIFGFAINSNPKHLSTYILSGDRLNPFTRSFISGLQNSEYFNVKGTIFSQDVAKHDMLSGKAQFVVNIPPNFYRELIRGESPKILLEADSTDPQSVGAGLATANRVFRNTVAKFAKGPLSYLKGSNDLVELNVHRNYNPDEIMQFSTVPSLLGVILTLTMVFVTALSMTRPDFP